MICKTCGSELPSGSHFCPICRAWNMPVESVSGAVLTDEEYLALESQALRDLEASLSPQELEVVEIGVETLGIVDAYALEAEGASPIPVWSIRERQFVADMLITEGFPTTESYRRRRTRELVRRPIIRFSSMDKRQTNELSSLWGTKTSPARFPTKRYGTMTRYDAKAGSARASVILMHAWDTMLECNRKEIYRSFMFDFLIPYTTKSLEHKPTRAHMERETGYTRECILELQSSWTSKNFGLPTLPWRVAERESLWRAMLEKPEKPPIIEVPE